MGSRSGVEVDWFRLPVVQDSVMGGWRGIGVVLSWVVWWVSCGVMVLGMSSLCHDVGLGYGVCSLVGFFIDDAGLGLGWWR